MAEDLDSVDTSDEGFEDSRTTVQRYDFTNPVILTELDLQRIKSRIEKFAYYLGGHLSMFLRKELNVSLSSFESTTYSEYTKSLPEPTCLRLFKLEQLHGVCLLELNPKLAISIVEVLLGGQGHAISQARDLTDIEKALIDDVVDVITDEYTRQWEDVIKLDASIIGRESTGRFLQTSPKDSLMLIVKFEASFGEVSGNITLAIPYYTLSPLISKLTSFDPSNPEKKSGQNSTKWHTCYDTINVPIKAQWDVFEISISEILSLKSGDIIELSKDLIPNTTLRIEGKDCFIGEVGVNGEKTAIKITKSCISEE